MRLNPRLAASGLLAASLVAALSACSSAGPQAVEALPSDQLASLLLEESEVDTPGTRLTDTYEVDGTPIQLGVGQLPSGEDLLISDRCAQQLDQAKDTSFHPTGAASRVFETEDSSFAVGIYSSPDGQGESMDAIYSELIQACDLPVWDSSTLTEYTFLPVDSPEGWTGYLIEIESNKVPQPTFSAVLHYEMGNHGIVLGSNGPDRALPFEVFERQIEKAKRGMEEKA